MATNTCGTSGYMAPEVYRPRGGHDPARADVWAATCVTFILAMGSPPVTTASPECWFFRQIQNNRWDHFWKAHEKFGPTLSDEFKAVSQSCCWFAPLPLPLAPPAPLRSPPRSLPFETVS